ncbi:hypothetical protein Tco_0323980 [Tanacetum coccineum]
MTNLNQVAIDSKSELLSEQILLFIGREMERELRMTRILIDLCHEVTDAVRKILHGEDLDKAKSIMKLINDTQEHTCEKCAFIAKVKLDRN